VRKSEGAPAIDRPPIAVSGEEWREILAILLRHIPGHRVWAFGSRTQGRPKPYSDLDLAVDPPLSPAQMDALREAFRESNLPWKVDIVELAKVSEEFRRIIEAECVRIFPEPESS